MRQHDKLETVLRHFLVEDRGVDGSVSDPNSREQRSSARSRKSCDESENYAKVQLPMSRQPLSRACSRTPTAGSFPLAARLNFILKRTYARRRAPAPPRAGYKS
ncbi:hypothetical protein EVAR_6388_1 [Eumeta japonica]|uniref:Uncharacterized protein n=1 Tax=Eumeta variegata TaxID=151549 RepID=A0A4C1TFX8_EUMVA|nr:hypothetical protein EVAR_6388_1 [Eumeta japonica]